MITPRNIQQWPHQDENRRYVIEKISLTSNASCSSLDYYYAIRRLVLPGFSCKIEMSFINVH